MTIGLVGHYLGARMGIGTFIDRLIPPLIAALNERGIDAKVITSPNALSQTPAIQSLQQRSPEKVSVLPPLDYSPLKRFAWVATQFSSYCHQSGIDQVLWLSNPMVLPWHPPSLVVLHDVNEWKAKEKYGSQIKTTLRAWMYLEASIAWAKKIITISEATTADLRHFRPQPSLDQKIRTIPNGLDSPLADLTPAEIDPPSAPFLLSVGRIDPAGKKLPEAIALTQALRTLSNDPWEIHLMGGMNKSTQQAGEAFLQEVESLPWAYYHGFTTDAELAAWYSQSTAAVFLSQNEGFGSPIAEAASFGKRVVINADNPASFGAGGDAIIPVVPGTATDQAEGAAAAVLSQLKHDQEKSASPESATKTSSKAYTYADAADAYANEISQLAQPV
ncbi:MAG: glycosyltransferase [Phormidesmis sp.]